MDRNSLSVALSPVGLAVAERSEGEKINVYGTPYIMRVPARLVCMLSDLPPSFGCNTSVPDWPRMWVIARQPIFTAGHDVLGSEILFRAGPDSYFTGDAADISASVVDNVLLFGIDRVTSGRWASSTSSATSPSAII